jgi:PAS domain S-box-containing protein
MENRQESSGTQNGFRRLVDALPGLVWTALPDGSIDFLNHRWCELTGIRAEDGYGQGWQAAIHPDDLQGLLENWRFILSSGEPGELEARFRRSDGEYRWFLIRAEPVHDDEGKVVGWHGVNTDIHDRAVERERSQLSLRTALDELKKSEQQLRTIIDAIPTIAWRSLPDGSSEFKNQRWHDYTGISTEAAQGWGWGAAIHPEDRGALMDMWRGHLATGQAGEVEGRLRRFDGEYRWFLCRFEPLQDETGNIVNWYGTATDIGDRKRAEALLAGEKQLLEMVAAGSPLEPVPDSLCRLVDSNAEGCFTGVLLLDRTGTKIGCAIGPGLSSSFREYIKGRPVTCAEGPCTMAVVLKSQVIVTDVTSDPRWESDGWPAIALACGIRSCWSTPIRSQTGEVLGTFFITKPEPGSPTPFHEALIEQFTHIASIAIDRTRSEEALKRSEASLAEAQRLSSTGSYRWNAVTDEIKWSAESCRIFGFDPGTPMTLDKIFSRTHPDDLPALHEQIKRARDGETEVQAEFRLLMPDGSVRYLQYFAHGNRDELGQLEFTGAIQDLTDRRRSEIALNKLRSELARVTRVISMGALTASIAHEVNQPLSGIITNASTCLRMLDADPPDVNGARETARRTLRDGNRASDVITRLRALFDKKMATTESVNLNDASREVMALARNELQRSRVSLHLELDDGLPDVTGDRVQLQQVILNLVLNASQAMSGIDDRPRQLVIRTQGEEGDGVRLSVQDVGIGVNPQDGDRLFEAFYTTKTGGMGMGLSVSRSIIENHQGRLWASPNNGPGATFSFSIPCKQEAVVHSRSTDASRISAVNSAQEVVRSS